MNYRDDLRLHVRPFFEGYTLGEITTGRVQTFLKGEATVSYSRAKHSRTVLNQVVGFALRHDVIRRNPIEGTSPLNKPKGAPKALDLDQIQAIRVAAATWRRGPGVKGPGSPTTRRVMLWRSSWARRCVQVRCWRFGPSTSRTAAVAWWLTFAARWCIAEGAGHCDRSGRRRSIGALSARAALRCRGYPPQIAEARTRAGKDAATSGPRTPTSGRSRASRTVTWAPALRAAAATSRPIHPPPTITSRRPG